MIWYQTIGYLFSQQQNTISTRCNWKLNKSILGIEVWAIDHN